jgi:H+/gluconate symporter-like permease
MQNDGMSGIMIILLALAALMALAYRGASPVLIAPVLAAAAVAASGQGTLLGSYTQVFMRACGEFIVSYFPLFLLGAIFGKLMEVTGSARALAAAILRGLGAERALLAVVLACAAMTYGGVSLFVVAFAVWPIAASLFRAANLPRRLIPGTIALGAFTFTMTALPGTPAIQNAIPMPFFGTTPYAAPGLGILTALIMFTLGWRWLEFRAARIGHDDSDDAPQAASADGPPAVRAALPLVLVIALNALFTWVVIPRLDTAYLAQPTYGETGIEAVRGLWSIIAALSLAIVTLIALNWRRLAAIGPALNDGAADSLVPIFNTASLVGFGATIASLAAFATIRDGVTGIGGDNPLISLAISTNLLAGMTGSASGGMSIALATLGDTYLAMGQAAGIAPDLLHRVTAVATGGLDALPHNGAVVTLLSICGLTHRQAYGDIAVVAVAVPLVALAVLIALGTAFGSF